jgi:hypothetical protein
MASSLKLAAIVAVYNEDDFLSQFLMHYSPECDAIFVLDNESTPVPASDIVGEFALDGLVSHPPIIVEKFSTGGKFDTARKQTELMRKKSEAIGKFDYVMVLDCDEFIVPKAGGRIKDHLGKENIYATHGINIYSYPGDPPYDPLVPLTQQRKRGVENYHYSKPVIVRPEHSVTYSPGCHYIMSPTDNPQVLPPDQAPFWLLHYRGFDEEVYVRRSMERAKRIDVHNPVDGGWAGGYYWGGDEGSFRCKYQYERDAGRILQVLP